MMMFNDLSTLNKLGIQEGLNRIRIILVVFALFLKIRCLKTRSLHNSVSKKFWSQIQCFK